MSYKVVAPLVIAQDKDGHYHHVYQGGVIQWLSPEQEKHFLAEGLAEKSGKIEDDPDGPPAKTAPKADWVDYAISKGADPSEAEESTKQELVDLYGG